MENRKSKLPPGKKVKWVVQNRTPSQREFSDMTRLPLDRLKGIDNDFTNQIGIAVRDLLKYTKECRYRRSPRWQDGVPTFLCGGGGKVDVYSDVIGRFQNSNHAYRVKIERLPQPQHLTAPELPENSYDRLSVAYGLSQNALDIGRIIQANEIEDDHPAVAPSDPLQRFVSKDDV
jgi:hypothetical protein